MNNNALLTVIAVILLGIFAVVVIDVSEATPMEQISVDISSLAGEISQ